MAQRGNIILHDHKDDDDAKTLNDEPTRTASHSAIRDRNPLGWQNFRVSSSQVNAVYEAWEMIFVRPTTELSSKKQIFGFQISATFKQLKDGYNGVRAVPSYTQHELVHMVTSAEKQWNGSKRSSFLSRLQPGGKKRDSYTQDLSKRIFELPGPLSGKLGALLDCRIVATNKNPYVRREWNVVLLQPMTGVMTGEQLSSGTQRRARASSGKSDAHEDPIQKWLVVLCGQESRVCTSGAGFAAFDTASNPWLRVDEKMVRERDATTDDLDDGYSDEE